jgi:hypothetical protein
MLTFWNTSVRCETFRTNLLPATHQHGAWGNTLKVRNRANKTALQKNARNTPDNYTQKTYTKRNFPANAQHRVNTYAKRITRVLSFICLIKGCNLKGWVDKFTWQQQVGVVTFNSQR